MNDLSLYTDSDRYVLWGSSLARGTGFADFSQPEPERYVVNAPFYAAVLAPVLRIFPDSLLAAKLWTLPFGTLALFLFYRWLRHFFDSTVSLTLALFLAASPLFLVISSEVLSEAVFLCALFWYLHSLERQDAVDRPGLSRRTLGPIFLVAVLPLLREIAISVVGAACVYLGVRKRWTLLGAVLLFSALCVGGWTVRNMFLVGVPASSQDPNISFVFQHHVTGSESSLFSELTTRGVLNARQYAAELGGTGLYLFPGSLIVQPGSAFVIMNRGVRAFQLVLPLLLFPLTILGVSNDVRTRPTWLWRAIFVLSYTGIVLLYPVHDVRFFLPLLPFLYFYLAAGASVVAAQLSKYSKTFTYGAYAAVTLVVIPNVVAEAEIIKTNLRYVQSPLEFHRALKTHHSSNEYFTHPWSLAGDWFEEHTPRNIVIASASKGLSTFLHGRKLLEINSAIPLPVFERMVREHGVEYVVAPTIFGTLHAYEQFLGVSGRISPDSSVDLGDIRIWHIPLLPPPVVSAPSAATVDSSAGRLVVAGYRQLINDDPGAALDLFDLAQRSYPSNAAIRFYQFIAATLQTDADRSERLLQELFSLPQSTSFQIASRAYLQTQKRVLAAHLLTDRSARGNLLLQAAQFYWDFGFRKRANALVRESVQADPAFFTGLLWAWHYSSQLGLKEYSDRYLRALGLIDSTNSVVRSFVRIREWQSQTRARRSQKNLLALRIAIAREYEGVDLHDAALDEAVTLCSISHPPPHEALELLSSLHRGRGQIRAAERVERGWGNRARTSATGPKAGAEGMESKQ